MTKKRLSIAKICVALFLCAVAALVATTAVYGAFAEDLPVTSITLDIDFGDYDGHGNGENLPHGKTNKTYPVFPCSATDNNGNAVDDVRVTVYDTKADKLVPQVKGRFATESKGEYNINYVAVSGTVTAQKTIVVTVDDYTDDIAYDNKDEKIDATGVTGSAVFAVFGNYSGGVGYLTETISLKLGETELLLDKADDRYFFIPEKSGEYVLTYGVTDFVGDTKSETRKITVSDPEAPVLSTPAIPRSAIEGETLDLPLAEAVYYRGGNKYYVPVKVYFDGEDVTASMRADLTEGKHKIDYVCADPKSGAETTKSFELTVKSKNIGKDDMIFDNYFDFTECASEKGAKDAYNVAVKANADKSPKDASFDFSRVLPLNYLNIDLGAKAEVAAYSEAYLILTDSVNAADRIEVKINKLTVYPNLNLSYDDASRSIVDKKNGTIIPVTTFADGRKFTGFGSGAAYVSFALKGVKKDVTLTVNKIASTVVSNGNSDETPPDIIVAPEFRRTYVSYIGHKVYLPEMTAFDLFDKNVSVRLKVTKPDGTVLFNGKGGYTLDVTESGEYGVEYVATDASDNIRKRVSSVYVTDLVAPVINVSGVKANVKAGEEITLPKATITDNDTPEEKIVRYVYVIKGNNRKQIVGDTYKFTSAGEYKIRYVAYDANQNYTVVEFAVNCR